MKSSNLTKLHGTCQKLKWLYPQRTRSTRQPIISYKTLTLLSNHIVVGIRMWAGTISAVEDGERYG